MTTRTITIQPSSNGMRSLIGAAAASLVLLGGALLWQARSTGEIAAPVATNTISTSREGVAPLGGLAERYREQQEAAAAAAAARVTTRGGMAELYAEQEADGRSAIELESRMGGMAELYRDQAAAAGSAR